MTAESKSYSNEEKNVIRSAKEKALNLLSYSDKTEHLLREKLKEGDFPPFAVEEAIQYVKSYHYIDDLRYAENYIRGHKDRKSIREMRLALSEKGISAEEIEDAILKEEIDEEQTVSSLFQKKYRNMDPSDSGTYEKAFRYFASKGFPYTAVKHGILSVLSDKKSDAGDIGYDA